MVRSLLPSGALFGLGAALAIFYYRHKHLLKGHSDDVLRGLGITLAINLGYSLLVKNIDNWWVGRPRRVVEGCGVSGRAGSQHWGTERKGGAQRGRPIEPQPHTAAPTANAPVARPACVLQDCCSLTRTCPPPPLVPYRSTGAI